MIQLKRREFLGVAAAFGAAGAARPVTPGPVRDLGEARLRVGVVSDIHITNRTPGARDSHEYFVKTLRYFDAEKVDAVLVAGDLFTSGRIRELEIVAWTWNQVFPNDTAADGRHVERLFITGNHDLDDWTYHLAKNETLEQKAARVKDEMFSFHRQETWKRLFGEDYAPYYAKTVKGYTFIMRHWPSRYLHEQSAACEALAEWGPKVARDQVFFYCQHEPVADTVNATWLLDGERCSDDQESPPLARKALDAYPNCICLTGHSHCSLADERSIWQGAFTAVNCGCLVGWAFSERGRENGHDCDGNPEPVREMSTFDMTTIRHGMLMTVYDNAVRFHRREFVKDGVLGPDWVVPLATVERPYAFEPRRAASKVPCFAADAKVEVARIAKGRNRAGHEHAQVEVVFPSVTSATGGDRANDYSVRLEMQIADIVRVLDEKRVYSPKFMWAEADDREPVRCRFAESALPKGRRLRFVVTPYSCWLKAGASISTPWRVFRR